MSPSTQDEHAALLRLFMVTVQHFFGGWQRLFQPLHDPRAPQRLSYSVPALACTGVLLFLCRLGARRQIGILLHANPDVAASFQTLFGVPGCPHGDTLNAWCAQLEPAELQTVLSGMTAHLIRQKVLAPSRLLDTFYVVAVDGTGTLTFHQRHCPQCLTRTSNGHTTYSHPVLEAKLVTPSGFAFSLLTEFIENADPEATKQDCELKAFYRLAERLKQRFPHLPLCLSLDGLFAGGPTFARCAQYGWKYMIMLQEKDLPSVHQEFTALQKLDPAQHLQFHTGIQGRTHQDVRWVNDIAYVDSDKQAPTLAVLECLETKPEANGQLQTTRFKWLTNFRVTAHNVIELTNDGGRLRWKIENEGFNIQKCGGYHLEHAYSRNATACKVLYFFLQIAELLFQLMFRGSLFHHTFPSGVGSAKNLAFRLLEAWRNYALTCEQWQSWLTVRLQIRFDSS